MPSIPRMMENFSDTSLKRRWRRSMRIDGEWLLCEDGMARPIIRGEILAHDGSWQAIEFLVDTGADRTVLSAFALEVLHLQSSATQDRLGGVGGITESVVVETQIR